MYTLNNRTYYLVHSLVRDEKYNGQIGLCILHTDDGYIELLLNKIIVPVPIKNCKLLTEEDNILLLTRKTS